MSAIAQPSLPARAVYDGGLGASVLRSERSIAVIRIGVTGVVMWIYLSSLGIRRGIGPAAVVILALSALYGLASLAVLVGDQLPTMRARWVTMFVDILLVTIWVQATGGPRSEFWTLYLIVVASVALRFRLVETVAVAVGLTILHLSVTLADGGLGRSQLIYRPTVLIATGFAVGVLAFQRGVHRRERIALEALAESRAMELGEERAEVERLRRVDLNRSEFVAIAAHEFRSPLAAVIGVLSTLQTHGDVLDADVRDELIEGAQTQAERLARLVEDLLTVSRIEDGALRLHLERVQPRELVGEAQQAAGMNGRIRLKIEHVDPLVCDADAIVRVLTNLLDNARKYTSERAAIVISISQDDRVVRFAVRDSGPGVRPQDREAVFERFRRLGEGGKPGAGLGLYISRGLVRAHGGEIAVGDAPEGGAEFSFTLPRQPGDVEVSDDAEPDVTEVTAATPITR